MNLPTPLVSIIIPTRSRGYYLRYALQTCLAIKRHDIEFVILDNASHDETQEIVSSINDRRVRYCRSNTLLSMRNNWERGFENSSGSVLCFMGDDDGIFPDAVDRAISIFANKNVDVVMSNHAQYFWPCTPSSKRNLCILPRKSVVTVHRSSDILRNLPDFGRYMKLPCAYYGFVKRDLYNKIIKKQGRFFMSNMTDVYSTIALSMENLLYAYSEQPLMIAGISSKSNGGRFLSSITKSECLEEWKREDDIGFLPGFASWSTINSVIVEQGLRYCLSNKNITLSDVFNLSSVDNALAIEALARQNKNQNFEDIKLMYSTSGRKCILSRHYLLNLNNKLRILTSRIIIFSTKYFFKLHEDNDNSISHATKKMTHLISSKSVGSLNNLIFHFIAAIRSLR